jgi:hypothetical protein
MSQTRLGSFIEACINVLIGFWINFAANLLILPLIGFHITISQNFFIGFLYTLISIARSYVIRRWFNRMIVRAAQKLAHETRQPAITQPESYRHEGYGSVYDQVERISLERNDK